MATPTSDALLLLRTDKATPTPEGNAMTIPTISPPGTPLDAISVVGHPSSSPKWAKPTATSTPVPKHKAKATNSDVTPNRIIL
mmetsp:Transcript_8017/g.15685  ORF Transcript_8017/g.15685 Transcript_8017/m.15685 type:complete len:83 (-) Transcript_8017:479-727(-)